MSNTARSSKVQEAVEDVPDRPLRQGRRDAIATADLNDDEAARIAAARIPPEHRYSLTAES